MGGARRKKGTQLPRPLFTNRFNPWGLCSRQGAWTGSLNRPPPAGWRGRGSPLLLETPPSLRFLHSFQSLSPPVPAGGWSPARPIRTVQLGQTPILSKATIEKNLDLQGMWVTVCCTLALFTLQNNSPTLCDIPPDPRGRLGAEV